MAKEGKFKKEISRLFSLTASIERDESEARSMTSSFERIMTPKFIKNISLTLPRFPKNLRPISIKIEKKQLPAYVSHGKKAETTFEGQLKDMKVFKKVNKLDNGGVIASQNYPGTAIQPKYEKPSHLGSRLCFEIPQLTKTLTMGPKFKKARFGSDSITASTCLNSPMDLSNQKEMRRSPRRKSSLGLPSEVRKSINCQAKITKSILKKGSQVQLWNKKGLVSPCPTPERKVSFSDIQPYVEPRPAQSQI